jgi:hypothetical protein
MTRHGAARHEPGDETMKCLRYYDENTTESEGRNGRIYTGVVGWRWAVLEDNGSLIKSGFETKREAERWYQHELSRCGNDN